MDLKLVNVADLITPLLEDIKRRKSTPELQITYLPSLNQMMWGIRKRKLTVIGARTSHGKSAFAVQLCYDLAMQDKNVVFFSLEMENLECAERILASELEINNKALQRGEGYKIYERSIDLHIKLKARKLFISDCIGKTWQEINEIIETWHNGGVVPDMIVLDYIQNTKGVGTAKDALDEYIRKFREMAIRYNFAGVICSQINRTSQDTEDKSPHLHQLKGTGFLEEHADIVLLLHWPYKYDQNKDKNHFEINIAKNKLGETGWLNVTYEPEFFKFSEMQQKCPQDNHKPVGYEQTV